MTHDKKTELLQITNLLLRNYIQKDKHLSIIQLQNHPSGSNKT